MSLDEGAQRVDHRMKIITRLLRGTIRAVRGMADFECTPMHYW